MTTTASATLWRDIRERGSLWGMLFTARLYRALGRWAAEPVLWGVVAYFLLTDRRARRASFQYLKKIDEVFSLEKKTGWIDVYLHYLSFAHTSLDRFDLWTNRIEDYTFHYHGEEHLEALTRQGRGAVLLGAHLGNFDALRALARQHRGKVHIMTDRQNSRNFSAILRHFCPQMDEGIVDYDPASIDSVFTLKGAVERGEFIGLLGDRIAAVGGRGARRVSPVRFLGEPAWLPQSPYLFAAHLDCPVLLIFALRRSARVYDFFVEPFAERIALPDEARDEALTRYVGAFAGRLEHYCRQFPRQWFNFYDFWGNA